MRRVCPYTSRIPDSVHAAEMADPGRDDDDQLQEELSYAVLLSDKVCATIDDTNSLKTDCFEVGKQVDKLSHMLRSLVRISSSSSSSSSSFSSSVTATTASLYDRPIRRVLADVSANLTLALALARKCKRRNLIRRLCTIITSADFRKLSALLESSIGDMKWILNVYDRDGNSSMGIWISLPPIASANPILAWVWSFIACLYVGKLSERVEAANELASLAEDNYRNKKIIVEEGGVGPLLKLLREGAEPDAQIAAAIALYNLMNKQEMARVIVNLLGVPLIVHVLGDSSMRVQARVARLVARMAECDPVAQDEFARENVVRPLVTLLSFETFLDEDPVLRIHLGKQSIHSMIQNALPKPTSLLSLPRPPMHSLSDGVGGRFGSNKKERENELPEVKLELKTGCAEALWMLARGNVSNCWKICETKGLLCLVKLVEKERGECQHNCLMALVEITVAAESNTDLRRSAFKTNSPAAEAVVDKLLWLINETEDPSSLVPAIHAIGCLARTFPARETRVISHLVTRLNDGNPGVATEAAISLCKFTCPDNFLCSEHSKVIIDSNGIPPLMRMLQGDEGMRSHGLVLLCHLAKNAGNHEAMRQARVLSALGGVDMAVISRNPKTRELISEATYWLKMYQADLHPQVRYLLALH